MKVKICGMKRKEDVVTACYEGADAVGFIVGAIYKTSDEISPSLAYELAKLVPSFVTPVLVTHYTYPEAIIALAEETKIKTLQLQGEITPKEILRLRKSLPQAIIIKAIHVESEKSIDIAKTYEKVADMLILDTKTKDRIGGTGLTHDWSISAIIVKEVNIPVILAGGLNPDNVVQAIKVVRPYGVDCNTGTKGADGYKSPEKIRAFIQNAKGTNNWSYAR